MLKQLAVVTGLTIFFGLTLHSLKPRQQPPFSILLEHFLRLTIAT